MRNTEEESLQKAIWQHILIRGTDNTIAYAVPNGIPSSKRTGARFKAQGLTAGVFDLAFVLSDGRAAFLELKVGKGRLSPAQTKFSDKCTKIGIEHAVSYNLDNALSILLAWGVIE